MSRQAQQLIAQAKAEGWKRLDLGNCGLTDLETQVPELFDLTDLEELVLSDVWWEWNATIQERTYKRSENKGQANRLSQLPPAMAQLKQLKVLICGGWYNDNWAISDYSVVQHLPHLTRLGLSGNQILCLENLDKLPNLQILQFASNQILCLENLDKLPNLQVLDLSFNQIPRLENLDKLPNLQILQFASNQILCLENLDKLPNLQVLDLSQNQITRLENLDKLPNLQQLNLNGNQITRLENLDKLPNLQRLDLNHNQITRLENLDKLPNLQQLNLNGNQITEIAGTIDLPNLQVLRLLNNRINDLSPLLPFLRRTKNPLQLVLEGRRYGTGRGEIAVKGNPLTTPPMGIVRQGRESVVRYFEELEKYGKDYLYEAKLLVVGEPRAGKTTLRKKLIDPSYKSAPAQQKEGEKETVGVEIMPWQFSYTNKEGVIVDFIANIWDFGGQDEQYPLHQYFLTEKAVYVLLSDDRADNPALDKWFNMIRLLGGNTSTLLVVLNQIDRSINHTSSFNAKKYEEQGFHFAQYSLDILHETQNLSDLNTAIKNALCALPQIGEALPAYCIPVRKALNELEKDYLTYEEYETLCKGIAITDAEQQKNALRYLCDVGSVVHYENDTDLSTIVILNPHWVIDAIYTVLINSTIEAQNGRFDRAWLFDYWQKQNANKRYCQSECHHLLKLMLKNNFDICYRLKSGEQEQYLVPLRMSENLPPHTFEEVDSLQLLFRYEIMPPGLVARLIVRLNEDIKDELVCKNAVILENKNHQTLAKVEEFRLPNDANKYIRICVIGRASERKTYLAMLKKTLLDVQNDWFKKIAYEEIIPCPCAECVQKNVPQPILLSAIRTRIEKGKNTVQCPSGEDINVWHLLGDAYIQGLPQNIDSLEALKQWLPTQSSEVVVNINNVMGNNNTIGQHLRDTNFSTH